MYVCSYCKGMFYGDSQFVVDDNEFCSQLHCDSFFDEGDSQ